MDMEKMIVVEKKHQMVADSCDGWCSNSWTSRWLWSCDSYSRYKQSAISYSTDSYNAWSTGAGAECRKWHATTSWSEWSKWWTR